MYEDYEQNEYNMSMNENNRYINREKEYPYANDPNSFNYPNNNINDQNYNYYNPNINNQSYSYNNSQNYNNPSYHNQNYNNNNNSFNGNHNSINAGYSQNFSAITEKQEESINSINNKSKTIEPMGNRYFSKVIVENIRKPKDIIYILDNYLNENNLEKNYKTVVEKNKISFMFYDEETAFNFTKLLNGLKSKNVLYFEMNVHLSLTPNNNYNKKDKIKRRGLSIDSIERLFNGFGSKKQEKKSKINPNLNLGVSSPFLYPYEKKRQKKNSKGKDNLNNMIDININKLKDYNKLPIKVLNEEYVPLRDPNFRQEVKDKWICPTNFKF